MDFYAVLDQVLALLRQRQRVTYRALKLQFQLDDGTLEALRDELIEAQHLAADEAGKVLVWTGDADSSAAPAPESVSAPHAYTPPHLAEKILTSRSALAGERKQVTVLFADLKGSMELLADRDPEEARQLLDPVLEHMMAAVHRYEGTVNQVMGDGIMALFGAPIAHEDHAVRACYAALAMQEFVQRYAEEVRRTQGLTVQIRVGLNAGEVVVRAIGNDLHMDYSAIGQTTHLAARMEQLATPGSILLTAATLRLVEGLVRVNALGPVPVKGLAEPVEVFELVGVTAVRQRLQAAAARGLSRFVGRDHELESLQQALQQAAAGHGQVVTLDAALQEAIPALLWLLDALPDDSPFLTLDPPQRRQRTLDALKRVLLRESQVQPLVLVFEDLHWIDTETQALLDSLVESLPTARLLLLVNYRPEYQHAWGRKTYYTQLRLDPLLPASASELLRALLGDDPSLVPLTQLLIARTQGNPFFLEESVRTLVETQVLIGERGVYRLAKALPSIQVPATVQAVLAARIDRLPPEEKQLLQTASVIGTEVPLSLLQAIAEVPEDAMYRGLAHLQAAEFLYEARLFPEHEYTFKHALTHEVAYASLLQEQRRALHAHIVEALEGLAGGQVGEQVERLASHALRGEVWDKALAYFRQAGERALARSAHHEAVAYFEQALGALPHLPEQRHTREQAIDLRLALGSALQPSGGEGRILALLREAESLAETLNDPQRLGQVSVSLSVHFRNRGIYDQAIALGQRALALATASREVGLHTVANLFLGFVYHAQGDYRRAIDYLRQTVVFLDRARLRERFGQPILPAVACRAWLAACYAELGMFAEGRPFGEAGVQIAEAVAHPVSLMDALWGIGLLSLRQGDLHRALPQLERAVDICQDADLPVWFPMMAAALGAAYTLAGRVADAVPLLTQGMERATATEMLAHRAFCSLPLVEAQLLAGRLEEAHALAEHTLAFTRERQEGGHQAHALRLLGDIAAHRALPNVDTAAAHYRQALTLAEELGMHPLQAHCHRGLGTLYVATGQREPARNELVTAIAMYRSMTMTFWLPHTEATLAQVEER